MSEYLLQAAGHADPYKRLTSVRPLAEIEREYIEYVINLADGNIGLAAQYLKISPSTIYRKQSRWQNSPE